MLHDLRACDSAVLVDMAHDKHRDLLLFGDGQQAGRTLFHLTDRAGRRRDVHAPHGLDGVDDDQFRLFFLDEAADLVYVIFCRQIDVILRDFQAGRTQFDLTDGLFARDIQHRVLVGDGTAELQKHRRFAHARLTAQQYDAAQHDAAAQYAVKLGNARQDAALFLGRADVGQTPCRQRGDALLPDRRSGFAAGKPGLGCFGDHILVHGVPAAAAGAAAHPAGACLSAVGADVYGFQLWFFHSGLPVFIS